MVFAQASLAFSGCGMERQALGVLGSTAAAGGHPCDDMPQAMDWSKYPNRCFSHCTADLQTAGGAVALVRSPAQEPVLALPPRAPVAQRVAAFEGPPPGEPPPRILFRSFLI